MTSMASSHSHRIRMGVIKFGIRSQSTHIIPECRLTEICLGTHPLCVFTQPAGEHIFYCLPYSENNHSPKCGETREDVQGIHTNALA